MVKNKSSSGKRIGITADHGGFELKTKLLATFKDAEYDLVDFGDVYFDKNDNYPDFVAPIAIAVANGDLIRGIAVCCSDVGPCIAANKVHGIHAALITDPSSAHLRAEDEDMSFFCLCGNVTGYNLALELVILFLNASYKHTERYLRRLEKVSML